MHIRKGKLMKKLQLIALASIASLGLITGAQAQSKDDIVVASKNSDLPYAIDANGVVVRNNTGWCWRTSNWTKELAQKVKVVGSDLPVGCLCEKEIFDKAVCEKPAPAPVAAVAPAAPAPAPAAKPVPVPAPAPAAQKVNLPSDALFAYDKAELSAEGQANLTKLADQAKQLTQLEVIIAVGHADRIGSDSYNLPLSEKRAASVKNFLVGQGIPANKVYTEGKGETQPVTGDACRNLGAENGRNKKLVDCLAPDRRVEIEAIGTK
ncbi:MAG: hypothetical protein CGU29_17295 [Candidatus Dactylopiibacterium carminicum]|uniref:OmpA-like domain-containing protein n=2 Tax=Candidatus Dactylopiibacterium carminicum TaxID=857335 RepID=A0A272EMF1_9RHOO|nr:OmpA family protein [Candidatus Dactylopiibacterium carminicum]KAF7597671.1 hypothetical protein BGI27_17555 [Candidatus Dactylopiibacterium carminicum]PAS91287.1 MAG: hypothetical protein CGU29_17295 [Candidatus Dactylopiibacterium carminicum]PAS93620.1 MAG: hypothetical protein BSR46_17605 [Candidatus Dactylopiibacterium carminicum]